MTSIPTNAENAAAAADPDPVMRAVRRLDRLAHDRAKVLLVDDEPAVLSALTRILHREPVTCYRAEGAEAALETMAEVDIAVVISDQSMPGRDGLWLLAEVRRRWPDTVRVMLTGHASTATAIDAVNQGGVHRFLSKPADPDQLRAAVADGVRQQRLNLVAHELLDRCRALHALTQPLADRRAAEHADAIDDLERYLNDAL